MNSNSEKTSPIKRFWLLLQPDKKDIRDVYVYAIFSGLVALSLPLGIQAIINLIQGGQTSTAWIVLIVFVVLGIAVNGVLQIAQLRITENLQQKLFARVGFEFAYRLPRFKTEVLYKHYPPELMNRFFDTIAAQKGLSKILIDFSTASLNTLFGLLLLSLYHPFFIIFSLLLVLLVYFIFQLTARRGLHTSLEASKNKYKVAYWLEEVARTQSTFKLAGNSELPLERANKYIGEYLQSRENHFLVLIRQFSFLVVFKVLVATGLLAVGGMLVMDQQMNIGQFIAAEIIILMVMSSVEKIIINLETVYDVLTALEKIGQVTDLELENNDGLKLEEHCPPDKGLSVELNNVGFIYPENSKYTLRNLTFHLSEGEHMLVAGPNGSGKSTLLHIIAGLYDIQEGSIAYNGLSVGNIEFDSLRTVIGELLAEEQLFAGSLLENITLGRKSVPFQQVRWAVENIGLENFVRQLPNGYQTYINPEGKKLPKSIIQKILLARAIVDKPKLLLFEYAFDFMDETDRKAIIDFITSDEHPWTLIAVSNDDYLARKINRIAVMKEGTIVQITDYLTAKTKMNFKK